MVKDVVESLVGKVIVILWSIWKEMNERVSNNTMRPHEAVLEFLVDWIQARDIFELQVPRATLSGCVKWHPPPVDTFKCNCDAAIFYEGDVTCARMVLRGAYRAMITYRMV